MPATQSPAPCVEQRLQQALAAHRAGRLHEAENRYREILRLDARHPDAIHLLGTLALQQGRLPAAAQLLEEALRLHGPAATALNNLGTVYREVGETGRALEMFQQAVTLEPAFAGAHYNLGLAYRAAGQPQQAITAFENALAADEAFLPAWVELGTLLASSGETRQAVDCFNHALRKDPRFVPARFHLAETLQAAGRLDHAAEQYRRILQTNPTHHRAQQQLERLCFRIDPRYPAILSEAEQLRRQLEQTPDDAPLRFRLAELLQRLGRYGEALREYHRVVELHPDHARAHLHLGTLYAEQGRRDQAINSLQIAAGSLPEETEIPFLLGDLLCEQQQFTAAADWYRRAVQINEGDPAAWYKQGNASREIEDYPNAETCYRRALQLQPDFNRARFNLAVVLRCQGNVTESLASWKRLLAARPDDPQVHLQKALTLLAAGQYAAGWDEYEWRRQAELPPRSFPQPLWRGEPLAGKPLLVYAEQGVGDEIMFASCLPDLLDRADRCLIECDPRLVPLFARSFPRAEIVKRPIPRETILGGGEDSRIDIQIPSGSLPLIFRRSLDAFPKRKSYLTPDPAKVSTWRRRYTALGDGLKIGIAWRGGRKPETRRSRSTTLEMWRPVVSLPGLRMINLQYGDCRAELDALREQTGLVIHDWEDADPLTDLDGFAAQLAALDLVISVDNATVHFAGALGLSVWALLPFAADYRWGTETDCTPWYPSMRLFRQRRPRDWKPVFTAVADRLREVITTPGGELES